MRLRVLGCAFLAMTIARALVPGPALGRGGGSGGLEAVVFASGQPGGYYHAIGTRLRAVLPSQAGPYVELVETRGSLDNLSRLADPKSPVNLGLTQADALLRFLNENPEFAHHYSIVADAGTECAVVIARKGGAISSADDLKAKAGRSISVGSEGSGAEVTYETMVLIEPEYRNTSVVNMDVMRSLLQIKNPADLEVDALMLVQRPRTLSPPIEVLLDNLDTFKVIPLAKTDLGSTRLPDGMEIYSFKEVTIGFGTDHSIQFDTICTRAVLLANTKKLGRKSIEELSRMILEERSYIMPGSK
jgi:hypothetical protein